MHHGNKFECGELIVSGADTIEIYLQNLPHHVECHFKKKPVPAPCDHSCDDDDHNHHRHDKLEWEVQRFHHNFAHKYRLVIKWKVSGVREILWSANF